MCLRDRYTWQYDFLTSAFVHDVLAIGPCSCLSLWRSGWKECSGELGASSLGWAAKQPHSLASLSPPWSLKPCFSWRLTPSVLSLRNTEGHGLFYLVLIPEMVRIPLFGQCQLCVTFSFLLFFVTVLSWSFLLPISLLFLFSILKGLSALRYHMDVCLIASLHPSSLLPSYT